MYCVTDNIITTFFFFLQVKKNDVAAKNHL